MAKLFANPLIPLVCFSITLAGILFSYLAAGFSPSSNFEMIAGFFWSYLLVYWIVADTKRRQASNCYDFSFLCLMCFPLCIPWHCLRSRGWRGIFTLLILLTIFILPYLIASIAWAFLYG